MPTVLGNSPIAQHYKTTHVPTLYHFTSPHPSQFWSSPILVINFFGIIYTIRHEDCLLSLNLANICFVFDLHYALLSFLGLNIHVSITYIIKVSLMQSHATICFVSPFPPSSFFSLSPHDAFISLFFLFFFISLTYSFPFSPFILLSILLHNFLPFLSLFRYYILLL